MTRGNYERHPSRTERPATTSRTPRSEPIDGRRRDHPIYRRENVFRQVHQDANYTVYTKDTKDNASPPIAVIPKDPGRTPPSLLDQGQNPENQKDLLHHWLSLNGLQVCNYVLKLDQTNLKLLRIQQLEATGSQQVEIPTAPGLDGVDYRRPSQERDEEETDQDEVIRIPKPMHLTQSRKACNEMDLTSYIFGIVLPFSLKKPRWSLAGNIPLAPIL